MSLYDRIGDPPLNPPDDCHDSDPCTCDERACDWHGFQRCDGCNRMVAGIVPMVDVHVCAPCLVEAAIADDWVGTMDVDVEACARGGVWWPTEAADVALAAE